GVNIGFDPPKGATSGGSGSGDGGGGPGPSPGPSVSDYDIAVASDWSLSSDASATVDNIVNFDPDSNILTIHGGDGSYTSSGDKWAKIVDRLMKGGRRMKMCFGNHDVEDGVSSLINFYKQLFGISGDKFYSFTEGNMFIIVADMYTDYASGSKQYKFIKSEMEKSKNNSSIMWRVLVHHEPSYSSPSHYNGVGKFRDLYHPLEITNGFDLDINGHNHNYE